MTCEGCSAELSVLSRPNRRHCSPACRQRAYARRRGRPFATTLGPAALELDERFEPALVAAIVRAAQNDWKAAAWVLERRWPQRWAKAPRAPRRVVEEALGSAPESEADVFFAEVDELARRRRERLQRR